MGYYQTKLHQTYRICFVEMDLCIIILGVLFNNTCTEQRFVTSMTCKNASSKLGLTLKFEQNVIEAEIDQWRDSLLVADTLNTCCEILVYLYYVVHHNIL